MIRCYLSTPTELGQPTLKLDDSESWHLIKVLRARQGDPVALFDGCGNEWRCTLLNLDSTGAVLDVHKHFTVKRQGPWTCSLAQALPKGKTMDKAREIADSICQNGPLSIKALMKMLRDVDGSIAEKDALDTELEVGGPIFATEDAREGMKAFKEKRDPVYQGK